MTDFRSEPSESPEGSGRARRAWEAYVKQSNRIAGPALRPIIEPFAQGVSRKWLGEMLGFWILWHAYGGFEGLEEMGMHKTTIWRKVKKFRIMFHEHPDTYRFEGIDLDVVRMWNAAPTAIDTAGE